MRKGQPGDLDAVEMMRSIRDDLSRKLKIMTHEEQRQYIKEQLAGSEAQENEKYGQRYNDELQRADRLARDPGVEAVPLAR